MSDTISEATTTLSSSMSTSNLSTILLLIGIVALGVYVFFELRKVNRRIDEVLTPTTTTMNAYPQVVVDPMQAGSPSPQPPPLMQVDHAPIQAPGQAQGQARQGRASTPYPTSEMRQQSRAAPENAISEIDALMTKDITEMKAMKAMTEPQPSVTDTPESVGDVFHSKVTEPDGLLNVPFPDISDLAPDSETPDISKDPFQSSVQEIHEQPEQPEQPDQEEDHSKKSVSELKDTVLKWGLATSGNKKKLIQRINEHTGVIKTDVIKGSSGQGTTDVLSSLDVTVNPSEPTMTDVTEGSLGANISLP